jgi:hypothetical protein
MHIFGPTPNGAIEILLRSSIERWHKHRAELLAQAGAGRRPDEWWIYEQEREPPGLEDNEADLLYEMGELSEEELAELMPQWRRHFDESWEPGFGLCIGHAKPGDTFASWIGGAEGRRLHYRWAARGAMERRGSAPGQHHPQAGACRQMSQRPWDARRFAKLEPQRPRVVVRPAGGLRGRFHTR